MKPLCYILEIEKLILVSYLSFLFKSSERLIISCSTLLGATSLSGLLFFYYLIHTLYPYLFHFHTSVCSSTLHRRYSQWCAWRLVTHIDLLFYLHHAIGIVFLTYRNIIAADSVDIVELAYTELTCYALLADEIMFGEAVPSR